jgi:hypothetical protein
MKRLLWLFVLALPLGVVPGRALAWGELLPPMQIDAGINAHFNLHALDWGACGHLGPWYLYFPYEAHFMTPAPVHPYPNWPGSMVVERAPGTPAPPSLLPPPAAGPALPPPPAKTAPAPGGRSATSFYRSPPRPAMQEPTALPTSASGVPAYWYGW